MQLSLHQTFWNMHTDLHSSRLDTSYENVHTDQLHYHQIPVLLYYTLPFFFSFLPLSARKTRYCGSSQDSMKEQTLTHYLSNEKTPLDDRLPPKGAIMHGSTLFFSYCL